MQPISRESYAAAVDRLEELVTGERPVPLAGVADEILAVADLLVRQPRLRRALSDPSRTTQDRAGLLESLIDGKVTEDAVALLRALIAGRWSSGSELVDATERLGVETVLASADSAGDLAEVEDELFRFGQVVDGHPDLSAQLSNSSVLPSARAKLVRSLLEGKAKPATVRLAVLAVHGLSGRNFAASLTRLVELAANRRDRDIAYVTVASPMTEADERRLGQRLSQMYGRQVDTKITVTPEILGGVSVRIGHHLYDGTVARRLTDARAALAARH